MRYAFLNFQLDTERLELSRDGEPVHAEPQILELLALLVSHAGETLTKGAINEAVWRGRVVSDAALSGRGCVRTRGFQLGQRFGFLFGVIVVIDSRDREQFTEDERSC